MLSNFLFSKPKNVGNAKCRPTIDRVSTNYYRPTIGQLSAKCRRNVGEVSVKEKLFRPRHIWNVYRPCLDECRPTIDRLSTAISTECRPSIDRLSTDCRPPIDRESTATSTAMSTDISVDITHSKQDPLLLPFVIRPFAQLLFHIQ